MMSVGSNIKSSSGAKSSGGLPTCPWASLTLEEQLKNFKRIICKQHSHINFHDAFFESVARAIKDLRISPWSNFERHLYARAPMGLLREATPLHWAVLMDDRTMVRYILTSRRVDINATTRGWRRTALHYAIIGGNLNIIEDLLDYKADVCMHNSSAQSALYYLVTQKGSMFGILKKILANNVNMCDAAKNTPLHYAAREGAIEVVTYLLDKKANVNLQNKFGYTPLHYAAKKGSLDVVICFLQQNADVNALNDDGWSPLHLAAKRGATAIATLLVERKANINTLDNDGLSPLHFAAASGCLDIVTLLVKHKANINTLDNDERSPLLLSLTNANVDTTIKLIEVGADVHVKDKWSNNVLHLAIHAYGREPNMMDIVKLLQKHNVDANAKNSQGYSPFFAAIVEGHTEVVKELLQRKEKIRLIEECNGQTAIQIAFDNSYEHIKRALLQCEDVSRYVSALYRDRQVYVDAANAILVGAALIASVTFASWLQPPLGYTTSYLDLAPSSSNPNYVDVEHNVSLRAFWIFNTLSFYFAIGTVVFGARSVLPRRRMFIKDIVEKLHQNLLVTSILLACSVFFVIIAFGIAGGIVLTPTLKFQWYMIVPTIFGGLVCLVSLGFLFKNMVEDYLEKEMEPIRLYHFDYWNLIDSKED